MDPIAQLRADLTSLRMVVAIDSAMLLSVLRRMNEEQLAQASSDFLEVCEGLSISALFSEMEDRSLLAAQKRRDWWITLAAQLMADRGLPAGATPQEGAPSKPDAAD